MILRHLLLPEILELLHTGRLNELRTFIIQQPAPEIAELLTAITDKDRVLLFRVLPRHLADEVFSLLEPLFQNRLIEELAQEEVRQVLAALPPDDRTALFEELPARVTQRLLGLLSEQDRKKALALLSYPEDSVGRLMTDRYVTVRPEWSVSQALDHLRKTGFDSETMAMIYIIDENERLTDELRLRKLLLADPSARISDLLDGHFACLRSLQDREEAVQVFRKYDLYALPVVDADGILMGIVTIDDILDVAEEEATEDFHKLATVQPLNVSLKNATLGLLFRKRIGWLLGLVVVNIFTGMGIKMFEGTIAKLAALVALLPLLLGSGGNAGAQAATLVVRAIATGEIGSGDWWRLFLREIGVSLCIGLVMAAAAFLLGWLLGSVQVALIVAISMVSIVVVGSLTGIVLPMALNRFDLDPATASVPLITSVADILGVLIYFSIATLILYT
ncbi:MAG: magnesium transporter [Kiritimatiellae bacterium]|nr:magnesium transporter [Kiritimatiellia bacterium]MDD4340744.1 magnesium transporter [Kiritimatiellia bacterium]